MMDVGSRFAEYDLKNFSLAVGHWSLIVAPPGSGKTWFIQNILNNSRKWLQIEEKANNRLLLFPGDGDVRVDADRVRATFKVTEVSFDVLQDLPKFGKDFIKYDSNVIIIDDFIFFNNAGVLLMLRDLLFKRLRHKRLLVVIAVHTLTHIALFGGFLPYAKMIFFLASNANRNSVARVCQVNGCPPRVKDELIKELNRMSSERRLRKVYDSFVFDSANNLCIYNVQTKSLFDTKRSFQDLNAAVDVFDPMAGKYYLVPEGKLNAKAGHFPVKDAEVLELMSSDAVEIISKLRSAGASVRIGENCLELKDVRLPLMQTVLSLKKGQKVRGVPPLAR